MILWVDDGLDVTTQMARDVALLAAAEDGHEPVLRLFRFDPPGITLGASQEPGRELDLDACARDGVGWAVRPTGGRAIFHADEWTYALAAPIDDPDWGGTRDVAYDRVSRLLVASLERLGVPAILAAGSHRERTESGAAHTAGPAAPCFASTARHEVVLEGGKLVGSAQRRTARALLQQGSLLLGDGHLRLADYLRIPASARERVRDGLRAAATHAGPWLGSDAPLERWADALWSVLGPGVRLTRDAPIQFPLTPGAGRPYTRPSSQVQA
ncbi:MAG: biotin/lipoate A/B protein ligase family protein [Candidatus Eisenbacteria bacterium]